MNIKENGELPITKIQSAMLDSMPKSIAISVMITLAINMIRLAKGELSPKGITTDPIALVAEIAAMVVLTAMKVDDAEEAMEEAINKAGAH